MTDLEYNNAYIDLESKVYYFVLSKLNNPEEAKDITQFSFMQLWSNRDKVLIDKAKSWLFTTAYNGVINFVKKNKRIERMPEHFDIGFSVKYEFDTRRVLREELAKLKPLERKLILLRDLKGYSYEELGEKLKISPDMVKVYLFRGRQKIKARIKGLL